MTKLELKTIIVLLIGLAVTCPLIEGQVKKGSGIHEQVDSSNESEGIGKDNSRLQTVEGKVKQPNPKVRSKFFVAYLLMKEQSPARRTQAPPDTTPSRISHKYQLADNLSL